MAPSLSALNDNTLCGMRIFHLSLQLARLLKWKKKCAYCRKEGDLLCQGHLQMLIRDARSGSEDLTDCASMQGTLGSAVSLASTCQL